MNAIPLTEKQPKDYEDVLVYGRHMHCETCNKDWHIAYFSRELKAFFNSYSPDIVEIEVTHWMPLPEPPKQPL